MPDESRRNGLSNFPLRSSVSLEGLQSQKTWGFLVQGELAVSSKWGPLFKDGIPRITDISQGLVGDCTYLAALAGITYRHPDYVKDMFTDLGNGRYDVNLNDFVTVNVGEYIPVAYFPDQSKQKIATAHPVGSIWVPLAEKAIAKLVSGRMRQPAAYRSIDAASSVTALNDLGFSALRVENDTFNRPPERQWGRFSLGESYLNLTHRLLRSTDRALAGGEVVVAGMGNHAYAVLKEDTKNGRKGYLLYDPHGHEEFYTRTEFRERVHTISHGGDFLKQETRMHGSW